MEKMMIGCFSELHQHGRPLLATGTFRPVLFLFVLLHALFELLQELIVQLLLFECHGQMFHEVCLLGQLFEYLKIGNDGKGLVIGDIRW